MKKEVRVSELKKKLFLLSVYVEDLGRTSSMNFASPKSTLSVKPKGSVQNKESMIHNLSNEIGGLRLMVMKDQSFEQGGFKRVANASERGFSYSKKPGHDVD